MDVLSFFSSQPDGAARSHHPANSGPSRQDVNSTEIILMCRCYFRTQPR
jgi:hypothetical protein